MKNQENYIKKFVDQIIKESGLDKMPKDFLEEYSEKLTMEAQKRLGLVTVRELNEKQIKEFTKIAKETEQDSKAVNDFLITNINNFEKKMTIALQDFGKEIINSAKKLNS